MSSGNIRVIRIVLSVDSAGAVQGFAEADAAAAKTETSMQKVGNAGRSMSSVGKSMTMVAVPLVALGVYAVKTAATFQASMTMIRTQVGASVGEVTNMSAAILKLAPKVGEGPNALAQALYPIESVGLRGAAALNALRAAAMGAQVSGASLSDTADILAGTLRVGFRDVHGAADAMSILNATTAAGKLHLQDLNVALATGVGVEAQRAGLGLRDIGTAMAAMARQGIPAVDEATRLKLNLIQLEGRTGSALKALQSIGLTQFQLADDMKKPNGLIVALMDLRTHLQGVGKDQQNLVLSQAFGGAKGSANVAGLINALPMMRQIQPGIQAAGQGQLTSAFATRTKNLTFQWQQFKAIADVALVGLGNSLMPLVREYLPKLAKFVEGAASGLQHMSPTLRDVVVGFTGFLVIGGPILALLGTLTTILGAVGTAILFVTGTTGLLDAALVALDAIPIVALFVAIGIGLYELATHFTQVKQAIVHVWSNLGTILATPFVDLWGVIKAPFQGVLNFIIDGINLVIKAIDWLIHKYNDVVSLGGLIPGGGLTIGTIPLIAPVNFGGSSGYRLNSSQKVGSQSGNSVNQTGSTAGGAPIVLHHTTRLGARVLTQEVVHFAAKQTSLGGGVLAH
jgi:TP901 family phage tail tape measure protein